MRQNTRPQWAGAFSFDSLCHIGDYTCEVCYFPKKSANVIATTLVAFLKEYVEQR